MHDLLEPFLWGSCFCHFPVIFCECANLDAVGCATLGLEAGGAEWRTIVVVCMILICEDVLLCPN